jgi:CRP-like cAMP-binding protein
MARRASRTESLPENRLLVALPVADRERLIRKMDEVTLERGEPVCRPNRPIRHAYFPRAGILSMVVEMRDGGTVEVGTIGPEGMVGLPVLHGAEVSSTRVYCQVPPCVCRRLPVDEFKAELRREGAFAAAINLFAQVSFTLAAQSTACNRLHPVEERLARWLLMTQDRVGSAELNLTQQILSEMLGVRRASVTTAAGVLQKAGLIEYHRGRVKVLNRPGLEAAACECYAVVRAEVARLIG